MNSPAQEPDAVTPRVLVELTLYERDGETVRAVHYDAIQPQGTVHGTDFYDKAIIGYAECQPYAQLGRYDDAEAFREAIERQAEYVHWKGGFDE